MRQKHNNLNRRSVNLNGISIPLFSLKSMDEEGYYRFCFAEFAAAEAVHDQREAACVILGLNEDNATKAEIATAYRKLARENHPDKAPANSERFRKINEAYEFLVETHIPENAQSALPRADARWSPDRDAMTS